ncbi:MAG: hypothetical protein KC912_20920 [Proteobacteria bacterium]|nr:hypothetical protein [Pseudomonadota bacterium]
MQQRLDRRLKILRGKREHAFNADQVYLNGAERERVIRKMRTHLRQLDPVVLKTPRWSRAPEMLDDLLVDLAIGRPPLRCKLLSLSPMQGRSAHDAWSYLVRGLLEFCDLAIDGPAELAVTRHGFRSVMGNLLRRTIHGERSALLLHGLETLNVEALEDLVHVFSHHLQEAGEARKLTLLLAGSVSMPSFSLPGAVHLTLPDYTREEAADHLVEFVGHIAPGPRKRALDLVGGVPALLDCLGEHSENSGFGSSKSDHLKALTPMMEELRGAIELVSADQDLAERLEDVARHEVLPFEEQDAKLLRAGILRHVPGSTERVAVRAPIFLQLLNA